MKSTHTIPRHGHRPRHGPLSHELRSEWASEWMSAAQRAGRSKQLSEQCKRTSKRRCKWPSTQCVDFICFLPNVERGIWECWSQRKVSTNLVFRDKRGGIFRNKLTKIYAHACSLFVVFFLFFFDSSFFIHLLHFISFFLFFCLFFGYSFFLDESRIVWNHKMELKTLSFFLSFFLSFSFSFSLLCVW